VATVAVAKAVAKMAAKAAVGKEVVKAAEAAKRRHQGEEPGVGGRRRGTWKCVIVSVKR
jgi:hypothetical protein